MSQSAAALQEPDGAAVVDALVGRARVAQARFATADQALVDDAVRARSSSQALGRAGEEIRGLGRAAASRAASRAPSSAAGLPKKPCAAASAP